MPRSTTSSGSAKQLIQVKALSVQRQVVGIHLTMIATGASSFIAQLTSQAKQHPKIEMCQPNYRDGWRESTPCIEN